MKIVETNKRILKANFIENLNKNEKSNNRIVVVNTQHERSPDCIPRKTMLAAKGIS